MNLKSFFNDHKEEILIGTGMIVSFALGYYICKKYSITPHAVLDDSFEIPGEIPTSKNHRFIDEDIFTNIAPKIEDLVLGEGVDEGVVEQVYNVEFPKFGDYKNGTYEVAKQVLVTVKDMTV